MPFGDLTYYAAGTAPMATYWPVWSSSTSATTDSSSFPWWQSPILPAPAPEVESKAISPETNLDWLHRRVDEIRELARVA